ncbi:histidinol-phosphate transaminase [Marinobacterium sediminicola]|uniref:Histidinol-phosphate aminotransferase n=1 Tax=Marinobacterium sediminicola TaxID=518898 RepID=A0ABY1RVS5_9GAMM|nr:histidinol-phosphate transaminase [Marinobacterium sediminicola]ULG70555.1 histidinol-phosphate transaminase [Marinobacterium sediminicola]SMR69030.1 histidinol-phosphate aminotransferase [Marinobacterium sediminicola]
MSRFWSPAIQSLVPYTPGEQPKVDGLIKLNTNENPYPPAPGVEAVLRNFSSERLRLYPDPDCQALKHALAEDAGLATNQVFVGNGSDEVLALTFMALLRQPKPLLLPETSYSFYNVYIDLFGINAQHIPLTADFRIELCDYCGENGGIIFANPNAPTSVSVDLDSIRALLERNTDSVVVVDEAYVDFGAESATQLINQFPNLLVIQTFSKSRSLAGMRVGFAFGHPDLIEALERVKNSFNSYPLDMLAQLTAIAAVEDKEYFKACVSRVIETRNWTTEQLQRLGFDVLPSHTNFVFASHAEVAAADLMQYLRDNKILVRHFTKPGIDNHLRITIGTPEEMKALIDCLQLHPEL